MTDKTDNPKQLSEGITLLDHFAGQAMAVLMTYDVELDTICLTPSEIAHDAYFLARAMLVERADPRNQQGRQAKPCT